MNTPTLFPEGPWDQQGELLAAVIQMDDNWCPAWERFVELVRVFIGKDFRSRCGVPWSKQQLEKAREEVMKILRELDEWRKTEAPVLDFTTEGGAP